MSQSGTATNQSADKASQGRLYGEVIRKYVLTVYFFFMYPQWTSGELTEERQATISKGQESNADILLQIGDVYRSRGLRPAIAVTSNLHGIRNWDNSSTPPTLYIAHCSLSHAKQDPRLLQELERGRLAFLGDAVIELVAMVIRMKGGIASANDMWHLVKSSVTNMALQMTCIRLGYYEWIEKNEEGHEVTEGIKVAKAAYEKAKTSDTHWSNWSKEAVCYYKPNNDPAPNCNNAKRKKSANPYLYKPTADLMEALFAVVYLESGQNLAIVSNAFERTVVDTLRSLREPVWNTGC
ncbi:MAG: hypothetical protein J3Q66DRAFT_407544 [Benniella sp.]|nr:MAG: hypothetical protein J3Q66DRAFT_407544 [Benniella sp.]